METSWRTARFALIFCASVACGSTAEPSVDPGATPDPSAPACDTSDATWKAIAENAPLANVDPAAIPKPQKFYETALEHYKVFATRDEAVAWAQKLDAMRVPEVLPESDSRYAKISPYFDRIWTAFVELYPEMKDVPKPYLLISTSTEPNAFAGSAGFEQIGGAFVVQQGLIDLIDAHQAASVIAHELAHFTLRHPMFRASVSKYYYATPESEPLGFEVDETGKDEIQSLTAWMEYVSQPDEALRGMPLGTSRTRARTVVSAIIAANSAPLDVLTACNASMDVLTNTDWVASFADIYTLSLKPLDAAALAKIAAFETSFVKCGGANPPEDMAYTLSHDFLLGLSEADAGTYLDGATNAFEGYLRYVRARRESLRASRIADARIYSKEEQADDTAILVGARIGIPAKTLGDALVALGGTFSADYSSRCRADRDAGRVPPYWIRDAHHSPCYRAYHAEKFGARALEPLAANLMKTSCR